MDSAVASHLAARLRTGVNVGTTIVLDIDGTDSGPVAGDVGVVEEIASDVVIVDWKRGFGLTVDRQTRPYREADASSTAPGVVRRVNG